MADIQIVVDNIRKEARSIDDRATDLEVSYVADNIRGNSGLCQQKMFGILSEVNSFGLQCRRLFGVTANFMEHVAKEYENMDKSLANKY